MLRIVIDDDPRGHIPTRAVSMTGLCGAKATKKWRTYLRGPLCEECEAIASDVNEATKGEGNE